MDKILTGCPFCPDLGHFHPFSCPILSNDGIRLEFDEKYVGRLSNCRIDVQSPTYHPKFKKEGSHMYDHITLFEQLAQSDHTPLETYTPLINADLTLKEFLSQLGQYVQDQTNQSLDLPALYDEWLRYNLATLSDPAQSTLFD